MIPACTGDGRAGIVRLELRRPRVEIGLALPDGGKSGRLALGRAGGEQCGDLPGILLEPLESGLGGRGIERNLPAGHAGQGSHLILIVLNQILALDDRIARLGENADPAGDQHPQCGNDGPSHDDHPLSPRLRRMVPSVWHNHGK